MRRKRDAGYGGEERKVVEGDEVKLMVEEAERLSSALVQT